MNRTKAILAAGTFTGLVLITILALGFGNLQAKTDGAAEATAVNIQLPETTNMTNEQALQAWQEYSAELEQTVQTMQERDAAYQQQLEAANQTILQLQDQMNSANSAPVHYEEHEHEEHEHEEHEYEHDDD